MRNEQKVDNQNKDNLAPKVNNKNQFSKPQTNYNSANTELGNKDKR